MESPFLLYIEKQKRSTMTQKIFTELQITSIEEIEKSVAQELDLEDKDLEKLLNESENNSNNTKVVPPTG